MPNTVASLSADLRMQSAAFQRDMKQAADAVATNTFQMRRHMRSLDSATRGIERQFNSFRRAVSGVGAAIAVFGLGSLIRDVVQTAAEFQRLQASLKTVTGGSAQVQAAFAMIKRFAATTPFDLAQVTGAFIKLKALGLTPSESALRSYGNTASAMGKQLNQFIEAVADASTLEFERLKEFGIKARQQADTVSFTFQGVTTTVAKNAAAIEEYLRGIGEVQFAGAMDEQASKLGGALSNFGDAFSVVQNEVGEGGLAAAVADIAREMSDAANGSHNLAREIGAFLGNALRATAEAAAFVARNMREIVTVMSVLAGLKAAALFISMGGAVLKFSSALVAAAKAGALLDVVMSKSIVGSIAKMVIAAGIGAATWQAFGAEAEAAISGVQQQIEALNAGMTEGEGQSRIAATATGEKEALQQANAALAMRAQLFEQTRTPMESFRAEMDRLRVAVDSGAISWELYDRAVAQTTANFRQQWLSSLQGTIGTIQGFTGALAQENDKWFRVNQAAGIANALISTYTGAAKALELGPIIGPILAAATVATGLAYVAQIASQKPGGGSKGASSAAFTGAGVGTGTAGQAGAVAATAGTGTAINVTLRGSRSDQELIRDLFEQINAGFRDGHKFNLNVV